MNIDLNASVDLFEDSIDSFNNYDDEIIFENGHPNYSERVEGYSENDKMEIDSKYEDEVTVEHIGNREICSNKNNSVIMVNDTSLIEVESSDSESDITDSNHHEKQKKVAEAESNQSEKKFSSSVDALMNTDNTTTEICDFVCPFCEIKETSLYRIELHVATKHQDAQISIVNDACSDVFFCPLCDLCVKSEKDLDQHLKIYHSDEDGINFSCPLCSFTSLTEENLACHVKTHNKDSTFYAVSQIENSSVTSNSECPMCAEKFSDSDLLASHVESHFVNEQLPGPSQSKTQVVKKTSSSNLSSQSTRDTQVQKGKGKGVYDKQNDKLMEQAVMRGEMTVAEWHEAKSKTGRVGKIDDGQTRVSGLIQKVHDLFRMQSRPGQSVLLCSPTDHFSGAYGDKGWGCGYRNCQMLMSCLVQNSKFAKLLNPSGGTEIPSVPKIQEMIETAWRLGFDPAGCEQLGGRLCNTRTWIGATEIVVLLSSQRIRCHLADFHQPSAPDGSHPRLFEWITRYFEEEESWKPPLYLQHQGHSRTVVGIERDKGVVKLLLFDPGTPKEVTQAIANNPFSWKQMRTFRRTQAAFKNPQYQIVAVTGVLSDAELEASKVVKSERVI